MRGDRIVKNHLVLAIFPNESAADQAVAEFKGWEQTSFASGTAADVSCIGSLAQDCVHDPSEHMKSGALGVLVKDNNGEIKAHKLGARETTKGAGVGLVLGIIATVLSGGLALLAGVVGGTIVGGLIGSVVHHGLGMSDEDLRLLGEHLDAGRAAVAVLVPENEAAATSAELKKLGGDITTYQVSEEALQQVAEAAKVAGA